MRPNGVLMAEITTRGGTISGTASVMQLDAWNWEDAAVKVDHGIHLNWPDSFTSGRWWLGEDPSLKPDKNYSKNIQQITNYFKEAKSYLSGNRTEMNLAYQAMERLFKGTQKLFIHVNGQKEITDAVHMAKELGINRIVIVGGEDADNVASLLVKNDIPTFICS